MGPSYITRSRLAVVATILLAVVVTILLRTASSPLPYGSPEEVQEECSSALGAQPSDRTMVDTYFEQRDPPYLPARLPGDLTMVAHDPGTRVLFCSPTENRWLEVWLGKTWQRRGDGRGTGDDRIASARAFWYQANGVPALDVEYGEFGDYTML